MFSWVNSKIEWITLQTLKCGPIPKHLAIIMDGNRRFAKKYQMETFLGHKAGFETLSETLRLCANLGIKEISVYAFSIENFKRSKSEVESLMKLAEEKLNELSESDLIKKHEVCVRLVGDISLLPPSVQSAMAKLVSKSSTNTRGIMNICFAYTSRWEMLNSLKSIGEGMEQEILVTNDISEDLIEECFYTNSIPDVLIRTSGETRLSDFLLWQSSFSSIQFFQVLWPEFSLWHIFFTILMYQRNYNNLQQQKQLYQDEKNNFQEKLSADDPSKQERISTFLETRQQQKSHLINDILNGICKDS